MDYTDFMFSYDGKLHGPGDSNLKSLKLELAIDQPEPYLESACSFVKTVVSSNPADIMKKLEECSLLKNVELSKSGKAVFFEVVGDVGNKTFMVDFPVGVKLRRECTYFVVEE